jgi:hypothetical protein
VKSIKYEWNISIKALAIPLLKAGDKVRLSCISLIVEMTLRAVVINSLLYAVMP